MTTSETPKSSSLLPRHVAVLGAAGGLGQGILSECRAAGIGFTAIVRSRPERIQNIPSGSRVEVVSSLANKSALESSFSGADAVLTALGITPTSDDETALLSRNMARVEQAMLAANVERVVLMNSLLSPLPGKLPSLLMRVFTWLPGKMGRGARELRAVADALGHGALSRLRWTLVRGGVNAQGIDEAPVASVDWSKGINSWMPVSYRAMGRWMLQEAVAKEFAFSAPFVSRQRN